MAEAGKDRPRTPKVPGQALFKGGFKGFFNDVAKEMRQTTWPSTQETWRFTGIVITVIGIFVAYLFGVDQLMTVVMAFVLGEQRQ